MQQAGLLWWLRAPEVESKVSACFVPCLVHTFMAKGHVECHQL